MPSGFATWIYLENWLESRSSSPLKYFKCLYHIQALWPIVKVVGVKSSIRSPYALFLIVLTNFVALHWAFLISSASRLSRGDQMGVHYSRIRRTKDLKRILKLSSLSFLKVLLVTPTICFRYHITKMVLEWQVCIGGDTQIFLLQVGL